MADPLAPKSDFSFTHAQLAGTCNADGTYSGLEEYGKSLGDFRVSVQKDSDASSCIFKCTTVVLVILALAAGGGSAALIYLSGGPTANLSYFVSGCVLGVASLAFLIGISIAYASNSESRKALNDGLQDEENKKIHLVDALPKMAKPEVTIKAIEHVIGGLETPKKREFIEGTYNEYFGDRKPPLLDAGQIKKVVSAFTACEEALILSIRANNEQFAWNLLKHTDPIRLTPAVLSALFEATGAPRNQEEAHLLASFPEQLKASTNEIIFGVLEHVDINLNAELMAAIMRSPRSSEEAPLILRHEAALDIKLATPQGRDFALSVLQFAPEDQNGPLLDKLFTKVGKPLSVTEMNYFSRHPEALVRNMVMGQENVIALFPNRLVHLALNKPTIFTQPVLESIFNHSSMNEGNTSLFLELLAGSKTINPDSSEAIDRIVSPLITARINAFIASNSKPGNQLLTAMGKWPHIVAKVLFTTRFAVGSSIVSELTALSELYNVVSVPNKENFVTVAAQTLQSRHDALRIYPELIRNANQSNKQIPLFSILAATPTLLAKAMNSMDSATIKMAQNIVDIMSQDQKIQLINSLSDPIEILTNDLLKIKNNFKKEFPKSAICAYLKQNKSKFKEVVLDNSNLGSEIERGKLALNILERMEQDAEIIIQTMPQKLIVKDYSWYNFLTNMLIDETQVDFDKVSESRKLLMARFYHAEMGGKKICDLSWEDQKSTATQFVDEANLFIGRAKSFLNEFLDESPKAKVNPAKPKDEVEQWKLKLYDAEVWKNFRNAAIGFQAQVYKTKS